MTYLKSSECVSAAHPDKCSDFIADSILDSCLAGDPNSKVGCEVMLKDNVAVLGGEITTSAKFDYESVVRNAIRKIGYTKPELGFSYDTVKIFNLISSQSPEINGAVVGKNDEDVGSGDQGIMWGYATNETPNYMPLEMYFSRGLVNAVRPLDWELLYGDCKTQVTIEYDDTTHAPIRVTHVVISIMHDKILNLEDVRTIVRDRVNTNFLNTLPAEFAGFFTEDTKWIINHAGTWTIGGPVGDCGVTGRKLVVDSYGSACEIGGGNYSGKDSSKTDRSAAYMARYVAKNIVAQGLASKCKIQLGYVIGQRGPVSFNINTLGTGKMPDQELARLVESKVSFTPGAIIKLLKLRNPIFAVTSFKGHFGVTSENPQEYTWERLDLKF